MLLSTIESSTPSRRACSGPWFVCLEMAEKPDVDTYQAMLPLDWEGWGRAQAACCVCPRAGARGGGLF
jgi:hypothetical protein